MFFCSSHDTTEIGIIIVCITYLIIFERLTVLEKRCIKKTKAAHQQHVLQLHQDIAVSSPSDKPIVQPVDIPQPFEDTWSPCVSSRGVKLLISTTCATRCTLKSADFIGAYLQAKVIGRHFVKLPLEYAYLFPEYANSQGFIQSPSKPSYFVRYNKQPMAPPPIFRRQHALRW
jgi:hypothetical protein